MWVFLLEGDIINFHRLKVIFKHLTSEKASTTMGNLAYLSILALAPTIILTTSILSLLNPYINLSTQPTFQKIFSISYALNLNQTTSLFINLICINLLSSGIFTLLSIFENIYNYRFKNYIRKKLYSLVLSLILLLEIIAILFTSFFITRHHFFKNISFLITLTTILASLLSFYKFATFQKIKHLYPGALISSLTLTIFFSFFYYIIENFSNINSYYGLLTPIIIAVLLIYYSCYIVYLGILVNIEFSSRKWM